MMNDQDVQKLRLLEIKFLRFIKSDDHRIIVSEIAEAIKCSKNVFVPYKILYTLDKNVIELTFSTLFQFRHIGCWIGIITVDGTWTHHYMLEVKKPVNTIRGLQTSLFAVL